MFEIIGRYFRTISIYCFALFSWNVLKDKEVFHFILKRGSNRYYKLGKIIWRYFGLIIFCLALVGRPFLRAGYYHADGQVIKDHRLMESFNENNLSG